MMNRTAKKILCLFISAMLLIIQLPVMCESENIEISSADDMIRLAKSCSLDTWSNGKTVILKNNINMEGKDFKGIPSFNGTFDGQGYSIKGIKLLHNSSCLGLFRYIRENGVVKNLEVFGDVKPGGTALKIGGIAGSNAGRIIDCGFSGAVTGKSYVGGIAGINLPTATVSDSQSTGYVYSEHYSGGIAGQNLGTIISCQNNASVNTTAQEIKFDIESIDLDDLISTRNTLDITDVGGIAGFSSGIIQSCTNIGTIGYKHVGYNIGGIAGRQSGYLSDCTNKGDIYGRKDVGGITGQVEPYTTLQFSEDTIGSISGELNKLQTLLDKTLSRAGNTAAVSARFHEVRGYADDAIDSADKLAKKTKDIVNGDTEQINNLSARLTATINEVSDALDGTDKVIDNINAFSDSISEITDIIDKSLDIDTDAVDAAIDELQFTADQLEKSSKNVQSAIKYFRKCVYDAEDIKDATSNLVSAIKDLLDLNSRMATNLEKVSDALGSVSDKVKDGDIAGAGEYLAEVATAFKGLAANLRVLPMRLATINKDIDLLSQSIEEFNTNNFKRAINSISATFADLEGAMSGLSDLSEELRKITDGIDLNSLKTVKDKADEANTHLKDATNGLGDIVTGVSDSLKKLGNEPLITITAIDDEYVQLADNLSDNISNAFDAIGSAGDIITDDINSLTGNLTEVSDQMMVVLNLMIDGIQDAYNVDIKDEISNRTADVSDEDTAGQTTGKVDSSNNIGNIDGDLNVGGIAGSLAFEYDFDPEDDIQRSGKRTSDFMFKTRAVIRSCSSHGNITAKKNNVGGIAGKLSLGCIVLSNGYGYVKSSNGDYVGGIAGSSESVIKECNSKAILSGDDYVGGIAGEAKHIYDCCSAEYIEESDEYVGGIAGNTTGDCARNLYCSAENGAVDSISYAGIAEPTSIDVLRTSKNGDVFKSFTATFKVDEKVVGTVEFEYGESLDTSKIPAIPKHEKFYSQWDTDSFEGLTHDIIANAEYIPYITAVEGNEKRSSGLAAIICEGMYSEKSMVSAKRNESDGNILFKQLENWTVSVSDSFSPDSQIHYLVPEGTKKKVFIFVSDGGKFHKVKYKKDGQYLVFDTNSKTSTFAVVQKGIMLYIIEILLSIIAAVIIEQNIRKRIFGKKII